MGGGTDPTGLVRQVPIVIANRGEAIDVAGTLNIQGCTLPC